MDNTAPLRDQATVGRIAKILTRLDSDHDGEALAAVYALRRTLSSAGMSFVDLGHALRLPRDEAVEPQAAATTNPEPTPAAGFDPDAATDRERRCWVSRLIAPPSPLTPWEAKFVTGCADQIDGGRPLSVRQRELFSTIWHKRFGGAR